MTVEVATYITDLQPANPPSSDPRAQGDDHLRLIKQVLQNTFPNANRAVFAASVLAKSTTYSIVKADGEATIYCNTAGGSFVLTLPSLAAADVGWRIYIMKTSLDANPVFVAPPSGTITSGYVSVTRARRCIPGLRSTAIWDGANWFITRGPTLPIGALVETFIAGLAAGYEWSSGATLASASTNYPEYFAAAGSGVLPDTRGCVLVGADNLGGTAAGRFGNVMSGTIIGTVGGTDIVALTTAQMPVHSHANSLSDPGHTHSGSCNGSSNASSTGGGAFPTGYTTSVGLTINAAGTGISINNANAGSGNAHSNVQPSAICNRMVVVE